MEEFIQNLKESIHIGFIDKNHPKSGRYTPKILMNNKAKGETILHSIIKELEHCQSFIFSVAFITESGLATLKSYLHDLKLKGITGRILTSTFLHFNQPKIFKELLKLSNVEVRLATMEGFHAKGYIFENKNQYSLIVGSSNLTSQALKVNYEWNVKLTTYEDGEIINHFKRHFEDIWQSASPLTTEWINKYEETYLPTAFNQPEKILDFPSDYKTNPIIDSLKIKPNKMQQSALKEIQLLRDNQLKKGLVISATGTGKTYLAAFDVRNFAPKRMLFIVHREQILLKAKEDFKLILGEPNHYFGILSGTEKNHDAKYLFATIQTISSLRTLNQFDKNDFDYILIDEVHKAGAKSYLRVIDYFKPKFLLGMTATPDRTDSFNIYELFDYHIAYEIRLQEALEEDMLCPFHYFGVTDFEFNGELIDDSTILANLVTEERVNHIIDKANYYGFSGEKLIGLIFCSRKEEAKQLSTVLNNKGFRTVALTGEDDQTERTSQINRLENGELDYIITVDIFNEGIDIPKINQIIMLRQTESSIIFIQQLGRGLRKHPNKDFVTIIDFIGNYKNNYLIPIALSGDNSLNKDNVRKHIKETNFIKGISTINFEEIARRQIFKSINSTNLTALKILKEAYLELKNRLGRIPYPNDFIKNHSIDPQIIVEKHKNYYFFLKKMKEETPQLSIYENEILTMVSLELLNGKRKNELILLQALLKNEQIILDDYIQLLIKHNCKTDEETLNSVKRILNLNFFTVSEQKKYGNKPIVLENNKGFFQLHPELQKALRTNRYFKFLLNDLLKAGFNKSLKYHANQSLTLYEKYSRKDVCKLLNWHNDESSTMFGYKSKHNTCPIFITYHKGNEIDSTIAYGDELINPSILKWYTRSNRRITSPEVQNIIEAKSNNLDIHVFVKKDDDEGTTFYYLGEALPNKSTVVQDKMLNKKGKEIPVVHMNMDLKQPINHTLFHYIIDQEVTSS